MSRLAGSIRRVTPAPARRIARRVHRAIRPPAGVGQEQDSAYYDETFARSDHWRKHFTESHYYPVWQLVMERALAVDTAHVLDLGCGPGQFAECVADSGVARYTGVDFSHERIDYARQRDLPDGYGFQDEDVFTSDVFDAVDYDTVTCLEFLEHVEADLEVLARIRPGTTVIATVPDFGGQAHVRFFKNEDEVRERYEGALDSCRVERVRVEGLTYFVLDGVSTGAKT